MREEQWRELMRGGEREGMIEGKDRCGEAEGTSFCDKTGEK